jgi:hypothetical protein
VHNHTFLFPWSSFNSFGVTSRFIIYPNEGNAGPKLNLSCRFPVRDAIEICLVVSKMKHADRHLIPLCFHFMPTKQRTLKKVTMWRCTATLSARYLPKAFWAILHTSFTVTFICCQYISCGTRTDCFVRDRMILVLFTASKSDELCSRRNHCTCCILEAKRLGTWMAFKPETTMTAQKWAWKEFKYNNKSSWRLT